MSLQKLRAARVPDSAGISCPHSWVLLSSQQQVSRSLPTDSHRVLRPPPPPHSATSQHHRVRWEWPWSSWWEWPWSSYPREEDGETLQLKLCINQRKGLACSSILGHLEYVWQSYAPLLGILKILSSLEAPFHTHMMPPHQRPPPVSENSVVKMKGGGRFAEQTLLNVEG